ncbi:prolyl aminopeptidase [Neorhizobium sp. Rsf11]|uniref:Proline iminopeptidase n=2 Tax=Neorhizobium TaxID=1525371 RepID=A0ABV0M994_9HYPH|nr:prolyl aminopeptidase [Neorhizobium petrolearium]MCC2608962.1 prolyl aminopeptidase [Neorhizobium petrolearium]WGI69204.1 prolyl aminopeptidase [Neorhizobium petrolearium]
MSALFPPLSPYETGFLETGDGNRIFFALSGNPDGRPVLILHGGPGSGLSESARRHFDPRVWRIIQFDQRGCGKSTPNAGDFDNALADNTTRHLIGDIEGLREMLGVKRWLVFGNSWGATLALAYAETFPERASAIILAGVTTTRWSEINWLYNGLSLFLPEAWERFVAAIPERLRGDHPVAAYHTLLNDPDPAIRQKAAFDWHAWEAGSISADSQAGLPERWRDPAFVLARARLCAHYFHHRAWLEDGQLLADAHRLAEIPGALIQGRLDLQGPPATAYALSKAWPGSELTLVDNAGHSASDQGMAEAIMAAARRFADYD